MSIWHAFYVMMFVGGCMAAAYFLGDGLHVFFKHMSMARRNRRWHRDMAIGFKQRPPFENPK